jgi:hypothetical protein
MTYSAEYLAWLKSLGQDSGDSMQRFFGYAAWIAAQDNIIKRAWEVFGEDFADDLMEIVDRKVRPEWRNDDE